MGPLRDTLYAIDLICPRVDLGYHVSLGSAGYDFGVNLRPSERQRRAAEGLKKESIYGIKRTGS